jgi:1-pyrroline-5-carboxylate dehydrogenase
MKPEFKNEPPTDFTQAVNIEAMEAAIAKVSSQLGQTYPLIIGGERIMTAETFNSINPADPDQVIGRFAKADAALVDRAIRAAEGAFRTWQYTPPEERARYLFHAAALMRRRKHEFSAWIVFEVGKSWVEADADTAEAIDFLEFYGREMLRLGGPQPLVPYPGEENELRYIPLGVGAVIPPWNFPLAILVGMTSAAIVAGNTVVLKPASTAPTVAAQFVKLMEEVSLPPGVLNFLPGPGSSIGDALVLHPRTRFIAFTGSKEVGLRINELAARPQPGQIWIKRTILEMGGKDAVVVDETADLDAAAEGIVVSAFGYQGQKCSAGSRAILVDRIYEPVVERVIARARKITVGPPVDRRNWMGPVIDANAYRKIMDYIEIGTQEGKLLYGGGPAGDKGYFIQPTVFGDVPPTARIAQEEIFGPVLACIRARDFDDALAIANGTEYGLTGSLYSTNRAHIERARREFHVGNLYFNRKCTGALVGVHPFGGFNMSGTDSKAGGRDYLLLFTQAKAISEKLP